MPKPKYTQVARDITPGDYNNARMALGIVDDVEKVDDASNVHVSILNLIRALDDKHLDEITEMREKIRSLEKALRVSRKRLKVLEDT